MGLGDFFFFLLLTSSLGGWDGNSDFGSVDSSTTACWVNDRECPGGRYERNIRDAENPSSSFVSGVKETDFRFADIDCFLIGVLHRC